MWLLGCCLVSAAALGVWLFRRRDDLRALGWGRRFAVAVLFVVAAVALGGLVAIVLLNDPDGRKWRAEQRHLYYAGRRALKGLYTAEREWFQEKDAYASDFATMGFDPTAALPYSVEFGDQLAMAPGARAKPSALCELSGTWPDGTPLASTGFHGKCPENCDFAALVAYEKPDGETLCASVTSFARTRRFEGRDEGVSAGEAVWETPRVRR